MTAVFKRSCQIDKGELHIVSYLLKINTMKLHPEGWIVHTLMHSTSACKTSNKAEFAGKKHQVNPSLFHEFSSLFELLEKFTSL